jgi:hypothetical protein
MNINNINKILHFQITLLLIVGTPSQVYELRGLARPYSLA